MRIGLQLPSFTTPEGPAALRDQLRDVARRAEDAGFSSLWVMDHFFQIDFVGPAEQEMLEGYAALSYLAALTEHTTLGTLVTGVTYRHPGVLAKTINTLDVLSGGRAVLGIGAAWYEREHRGLGVPFPPLRERFERLEETLRERETILGALPSGVVAVDSHGEVVWRNPSAERIEAAIGDEAKLVFLTDESESYHIELTYNCDGRDYTLGDQFGHLAFFTDDLEKVIADVEARGWWYRRSKPGMTSNYIFVKDPNGYDIEILERR